MNEATVRELQALDDEYTVAVNEAIAGCHYDT